MPDKNHACSSRSKRSRDNSPKRSRFRTSPLVYKEKLKKKQTLSHFWLVEGGADRNFINYLKSIFSTENISANIISIDGGAIDRYKHAWSSYYNDEKIVIFLFDTDIHPCGHNELPEDNFFNLCKTIMKETCPGYIKYIRPCYEKKTNNRLKSHKIYGLGFSPCLEGFILKILDVEISGLTSQQCKSRLKNKICSLLGHSKPGDQHSVQKLTLQQFSKILPSSCLDDAAKRIPELQFIIHLLSDRVSYT